MARSRKKVHVHWFRSPKGRKQAIINKARHKSIPPDAWDDINVDPSCERVNKIAFALHKKGFTEDEIVNRLVKHHGYERWRILNSHWYNSYWYKCDCEQCKTRRNRRRRFLF